MGRCKVFPTVVLGIPRSYRVASGPSSRVLGSDGCKGALIRVVLLHVGLPGKIV